MSRGFQVRMDRVFGADRRAVLVALDHLSAWPARIPELNDLAGVVEAISDADAVLISRGALDQAGSWLADTPVVLSVALTADSWRHVPETALRRGADLVKVNFFPFTDSQDLTLGWLNALIARCDRWGLPALVEVVPGGFTADSAMRELDPLAAGSRMAVEVGAAAIKTFLPPSEMDTSQLIEYVPVPLVIIGGDRLPLADLVIRVRAAVAAGAAGVAVGRNVWGSADPRATVRALRAAIHGEMKA